MQLLGDIQMRARRMCEEASAELASRRNRVCLRAKLGGLYLVELQGR
jgi:hypothetical protein